MNRLILFTALLSFGATAQETLGELPIRDPGTSATVSRWQVGLSFSPDLTYRMLTGEPQWLVDARNESEDPIFGYTTGCNIAFNTSSHFGIALGVHFSEKGYGTRVTYTDNNANVVGEGRLRAVFDYVEIPLKANFTLGDGKLRWTASAGIINGILIDARQVSTYDITGDSSGKSSVNTTSDYKQYNFSAMVGTGIDWQLGPNMHLKVEPTIRYGLSQIVNHETVATSMDISLWNAGVNTGLYFNL